MTSDQAMTFGEFSRDALGMPHGVYRHYKGGFYRVVGIAHDAEHDGRVLVLYSEHPGDNPPGRTWARSVQEFSGSVEVDGVAVRRFTWVEDVPHAAVDENWSGHGMC